ncbi:hypothetical protein B5X24_HaOG202977 [Helicoverpa armigera]|uniref:Uncharacterized protein n=1 Tax=Helicoverpa armigera TaxID=29058 RepID=A0A2W1BX64_HELAM|nr:hypothetical protein B5X24_HaOG202977 [Helicoverpa armigera]
MYRSSVSRSSTSRVRSGARQVRGRPPALARCPRASVLCPFARGLRGLRMSTSRAVSLSRPTTARASPHEVARGYSRSPPPRLIDRDRVTRALPPDEWVGVRRA